MNLIIIHYFAQYLNIEMLHWLLIHVIFLLLYHTNNLKMNVSEATLYMFPTNIFKQIKFRNLKKIMSLTMRQSKQIIPTVNLSMQSCSRWVINKPQSMNNIVAKSIVVNRYHLACCFLDWFPNFPRTGPCNFKLYLINWRWVSQTSFTIMSFFPLFRTKLLKFVVQGLFILLSFWFCQICCHSL